MKYDLKKPCANCPVLRSKKRVNLRAERIVEIHGYFTGSQGASFPCHRTVNYDDQEDEDGEYVHVSGPDEQHCAGGLIYALAQDSPNQLTRVALSLRMINPEELLKHKKLVFGSLHEWLTHADDYESYEAKRNEVEPCSVSGDYCEAPAGYLDGGGIVEGEESAEHECYECGQSVCGPCSRVVRQQRICQDCADWEEEER